MEQHERPPCLPPADPRTEAVRETIHTFLHTNRLHRTAIERALSDLGIHHTQHRLLVHLHRHGGALSQRAIAEEFDVSPAAVAVTLGKMEKAGYIRRASAPSDNRCKTIEITEAGQEILRTSYASFTAVDLLMFADLSEAELSAFRDTLGRMEAALLGLNKDRKDTKE